MHGVRRPTVAFVAAAVAFNCAVLGTSATAGVAHAYDNYAAERCDEGSRTQAVELAESGRVMTLDKAQSRASQGSTFGGMTVALRESTAAPGCVWALYTSPPLRAEWSNGNRMVNYVWIDRSLDGGETWDKAPSHRWIDYVDPLTNPIGGMKTKHSSVVDASWRHITVRACARTVHQSAPTPTPAFSSEHGPTICTAWFD